MLRFEVKKILLTQKIIKNNTDNNSNKHLYSANYTAVAVLHNSPTLTLFLPLKSN